MILNDIANSNLYGTILHQADNPMRGGICSNILMANKERVCFDSDFPVFSSSIFVWNFKNPDTSGDGIEFYSEPFGWNSGAKAGKNFLDKSAIKNFWQSWAKDIVFNYDNVDQNPEYKKLYQNFQQHPGSIRVKGNYLVVLYSQNPWSYCQVFYADVNNLNEMEFVARKNNIDVVNIVPTR